MSSEDTFHLGVKVLLRNSTGKIMLLQVNSTRLGGESRNYWDLPGGRVQKGDSVDDTLKREVMEETGITQISRIQHISMVLSNLRIPIDNDESVGLVLSIYAGAVPDEVVVRLSDEHMAYDWFAPKKAAELLQVKYPAGFCEVVAGL